MTGSHEPAYCELAVCRRCDSYGDGYSAGKAAAHFEIRVWEVGTHATDCGCRPCETIRLVVRKVLLTVHLGPPNVTLASTSPPPTAGR